MQTKKSDLMKKKLKIALEFQEVIYRVFQYSLRLGYFEGRDNPKSVIQSVKAYCYFRIPVFRDILLKLVVRKEDEEVEWKMENTDYDL